MSGGGCTRKVLQVWTLLLTFPATLSGWAKSVPDHNFGLSPPVFDDFTIRRVEAVEGQTLLLPCTVRHLGDKVVSWIRSRDLHILTSGPVAFSSDSRFEPVASGDFFGLRLRGVHASDAGRYECQVNTDPKMSLALTLSVSGDAKAGAGGSNWLGQALIKGPDKVYASEGSPAAFTCEILPESASHGLFTTTKPKVRWLHDNQEILLQRGGVSIEAMDGGGSVLRLAKVSWMDSGQYTCFQMSVRPDSVTLEVTDGYGAELEHSEAMQRDFPVSSRAHLFQAPNYLVLLLCFLI